MDGPRIEPRVTRYAIALGSNLGDRLQHLIDAHNELAAAFTVTAVSAIYETAPVGGPAQGPYLNAVVVVETGADPLQVLEVCQTIERDHGRERGVRWGPRTLDLDIVAAEEPHHDERLTIPHPRAAVREFVLRPLCDVWPDAPVGEDDTARDALSALQSQDVDRLERKWLPSGWRFEAGALVAGQAGIIVVIAVALFYDGSLPSGGVGIGHVVGATLALLGIILAFTSARLLGVPVASPIPRSGAELVTSGPYRFARHPIYGGLILFTMGTALVFDSLLALVLAAGLIPFFWLKSGYEERQLRLRFSDYRAYRETVPRRFVPFVL